MLAPERPISLDMVTNRKPRGRERRRDPRQGAGWLGTYLLPDQRNAGWAECRILDLSSSGVGLELFGPPWPPEGEEADIVVRLDAGTGTELGALELPCVIRNSAASRFGFVRVGVEFVGLTSEERRLLGALVDHQLV
jgi:PilZ domain